jgi:hypothetical protein
MVLDSRAGGLGRVGDRFGARLLATECLHRRKNSFSSYCEQSPGIAAFALLAPSSDFGQKKAPVGAKPTQVVRHRANRIACFVFRVNIELLGGPALFSTRAIPSGKQLRE